MSSKESSILKRAAGLINRYHDEKGEGEALWYDDPDHFLGWVLELHAQSKPETFSYYRKCLARKADDEGYADLGERIRSVGRRTKPPARSKRRRAANSDIRSSRGLHAQHVSMPMVKSLLRELSDQLATGKPAYPNGRSATALFVAGIMTGLRPVEWASARLHPTLYCAMDDRHYNNVLEVESAKVQSSSGANFSRTDDALLLAELHGSIGQPDDDGTPLRFLILEHFDDGNLSIVESVLRMANTDDDWRTSSRNLGRTVSYAAKKLMSQLWEMSESLGPLTLYTSRHLFASEVRRSHEYSRAELSAMLGHADTYNQRYYGDIDAAGGREFDLPLARPWPGTAATVLRQDAARRLG